MSFEQVAKVALWLHEELDAVPVPHFVKTSGASGLHVFVPIAPTTTFTQVWKFCELVSQVAAHKHPPGATSRGQSVYEGSGCI